MILVLFLQLRQMSLDLVSLSLGPSMRTDALLEELQRLLVLTAMIFTMNDH